MRAAAPFIASSILFCCAACSFGLGTFIDPSAVHLQDAGGVSDARSLQDGGADGGTGNGADAGFDGGSQFIGSPILYGCPVFPNDNPWNTDVSGYPVDPNSSAYIAQMTSSSVVAQRYLHPDFGSPSTYGIPHTSVPGTQPRVQVTFHYADESDPVPIPFRPTRRWRPAAITTCSWSTATTACSTSWARRRT